MVVDPARRRIHLSPPHLGPDERGFVEEAFASNWVSPAGPHLAAFEEEFVRHLGGGHAVALSSGTAALHLAVRCLGIGRGDDVLVSTFTFVASANPIVYEGARPVFIDSEPRSWNMDPALLAEALERRFRAGRPPRAVLLVHAYGQAADTDPIREACEVRGVPLIEDAAEAVGATHRGRPVGTAGRVAAFSFNGNKILTTGGGGMLVSADRALVERAHDLGTQARDRSRPHYEHRETGWNYRLSNVLAGIGRGQLRVLGERVAARRRIFEVYRRALGDLPGVEFMPEFSSGRSSRWLTCLTIDASRAPCDREAVRLALEAADIEARPLWKPLHLQELFAGCEHHGGDVAARLFRDGLCLPSGSALTDDELARVIDVVRGVFAR